MTAGGARLTPQQVEVVWVEQLEAKQRENHLHRKGATVDKIAIEQLQAIGQRKASPR